VPEEIAESGNQRLILDKRFGMNIHLRIKVDSLERSSRLLLLLWPTRISLNSSNPWSPISPPVPFPSSPTSVYGLPCSVFFPLSPFIDLVTDIHPPPPFSNVTLNTYIIFLHTTPQIHTPRSKQQSNSIKVYLPYLIAQPLFLHHPLHP
jgi:hypothetical protein